MMAGRQRVLNRSSGFSLVELMISVVLGIVIVGGCISIFSGVVRSSSLNQTVANLQSNARFALDMIGRDVRASGFLGCASERDISLNITFANPPTNDLTRTALTGYVVGDTTWEPSLPQAYTAPVSVGSPVPGTHALSVHYADFPGAELAASMTSSSANIVIEQIDDGRVRAGQLMLLSDCSSAELFSIASVTSSSDELSIGTGASLAKGYQRDGSFPENTRAMPFVSSIYYIGDTQRTSELGDDVYALYAHSYPYTAANPPLELIEGVDQLVLQFGVRQADGTFLYTTPGGTGYRVNGVETVRVGLLLGSLERFAEVDATRSYMLAGQKVTAQTPTGTATAPTYVSDKRLRMPFNATFTIRNRNL